MTLMNIILRQFITTLLAVNLVLATMPPVSAATSVARDYDFYNLTPDFAPGYRPPADGKRDEIGLWYYMDKIEDELKDSPFVIRDEALNAYVRDITCRLAPEYCDEIRIYIVQTPDFNAQMAPNGMMQIWSGLLLRTRSEAQLAAVIGHELGHYLRRHSITWWRSTKKKAAAANFLSVTGASLISLLLITSVFSYSRDQEREADAFGLRLMLDAGYDPEEASRVWAQLIKERDANEEKDLGIGLFKTHPSSDERMENLGRLAEEVRVEDNKYQAFKDRYVKTMLPYRALFMEEQLKFPKPEGTLYLINDMIQTEEWGGELLYYKGEVFRRRGADGDYDEALTLYQQALEMGGVPPELWRSMGICQLKKKDYQAAKQSFEAYLELVPEAEDREMIEFYMQYGG